MPVPPPPLRCAPPFWARGGHAQTILGHVLPSRAPRLSAGSPGMSEERIELGGGEALHAVHAQGRTGVTVHLFHGLAGDLDAAYVRRAARLFMRQGHAVLAVDHRGCGRGRGWALGPYHSGSASDLGCVIAWARERWPADVHVAVGFSLSGNALLLALADRLAALPDAAVAVNPPVDLAGCAACIARLENRLYELRFVRELCADVRGRAARGGYRPARALSPWISLRELDERYTAPAGGFLDADDYYRRASTAARLASIEVPTAVLTAADDPFVEPAQLLAAPRSPAVHVHVEPHGGHMGYLSARPTPLGDRRWLDYALDHYVGELLARARNA